jgi:hypothetical protein
MALDRGGRSDVRQRRAFQKLSDNPFGSMGIIIGSGLVWSPPLLTLGIELLPNGGLEFVGTPPNDTLAVNVDENFGLSLNSTGIRVDVTSTGGLQFTGGDLAIKLDTNPGLVLSASGEKILLDTNPGLILGPNGLAVKLDTNPGLTLGSGGLRLTYGTANQVSGMNSGATGPEFKTLATGTSGTNFAIAHTANTVTFNLPNASATATGKVSTGTQTFAGNKTFNDNVSVAGSLDAGASTLNSLLVLNGAEVAGDLTVLGSLIAGIVSPSNFFSLKWRAISDANYTVSSNDDIIVGYATLTAARVVTLPDAISPAARYLVVKDESGACSVINTLTLTPVGGQTVDGAATKVINVAYGVARLYNNGVNWFTF